MSAGAPRSSMTSPVNGAGEIAGRHLRTAFSTQPSTRSTPTVPRSDVGLPPVLVLLR